MNDHHNSEWLAERAHKAMLDNGFKPQFSDAVFDQVDAIRDTDISDLTDVEDLRSLAWSSIDNKSSRDLDQLEWAERLPDGVIRVLVAIADVDAYIKKDTPIDRHAGTNTVTVYTQGRVFPMLPEALSTDITSLNEGEDRLAVVADMAVQENGHVPESRFFRALVKNHARLSYEEVGDWLEEKGDVPRKLAENSELRAQVELHAEAAVRLYGYRREKGALEFESIESSAVVEDGEVKRLETVVPNRARKLIENFMVTANVEMAEYLEARSWPSIRRVVKEPRNWDGIRSIAAEFGVELPESPDQPALADFLETRRRADPEHFADISLSIVKLIGSGEYVVERPGEDAGGHFGLAVRDYAHSTAPNRRFADIVVQRMVKALIAGDQMPYSAEELDRIADQCNRQETAARKVERKMRKVVAASVMKRHIGEDFDAIVTGINANGTFARILRPPVDGRIERNERGLTVGQKIRVKLISADPRAGFIDFAAIR